MIERIKKEGEKSPIYTSCLLFECLKASAFTKMSKNMLPPKMQPILVAITNKLVILLMVIFWSELNIYLFLIILFFMSLKQLLLVFASKVINAEISLCSKKFLQFFTIS